MSSKCYNQFMSRNNSMEATVLSLKQSGENNRSVCFLTPDQGIIYGTLFGGPKSKLKSLVSPFNKGTLYLYTDETKKTSKITDFDVKSFHLSFRENLFKTWAANLGAEILIKTKCAGSPSQAFVLYNGLLDGMELCDENDSRLGLIRFLWRYMWLLGIKPDTSECRQCGKSFLTGKLTTDTIKYKAAYIESENGFVCEECTSMSDKRFVLSRPSITYLEAISVLSPREVRSIVISGQTLIELKDFCYWLIENACSSSLLSLQSGIGIL